MYQRRKSSIANLRFFHNWIKRSTIDDAVKYIRQNYDVSNIKLLDLAVGKGGDMRKWFDSGIYDVVGIDIDDQSINGENGAKDRYRKFKNQVRRNLNYSFYVLDLSDPKSIPKLDKILSNQKFNIVSCQFAIHYFFRSPEALDTFTNIATRYMANNALFIGTTMDGIKVQELLDRNNNIIKKNLYSIEGVNNNKDKIYGRTYKVSLGRPEKKEEHYFSEKPSIEYMVDIEELERVAKKYSLIFAGKQSFEQWYSDYPKRGNMNPQEREFSFLNFSFAFKKSSS